jgi:N-acetylneuraminic acid mutarotase
MLTARQQFSVAVGGNGRIYAIGGTPGNAVEEYNPQTDHWSTRSPLPVERLDAGVTSAPNGKIYVVGGYSNGGAQIANALFEYDPGSDQWYSKAPMPTPRMDLAFTATANGMLYAIGGWPGPNGAAIPRSEVEEYNPATDTWTSRTPLPAGRCCSDAAAGSDGLIYVFGGNGFASPTYDQYDPIHDRWGSPSLSPIRVFRPSVAATSDGTLYVIGSDNTVNDVMMVSFNPTTRRWSPDGVAPTTVRVTSESPQVSSRLVHLSVTADDINPLADISFSNNGTVWGSWVPVAPSVAWELSDGDGTKTVYARVRDVAQNVSLPATTEIVLDMTPPALTQLLANGAAHVTSSAAVTLTLQASDAGGSGVAQVSYSNDAGATWSEWEAYAATKANWQLAPGDGPKTVQARVRDGAGNVSQVASASITLDTSVGSSYGVSINSAAVWTNTTSVNLSLPAAPGTAKMMLSNDGGFTGAQWEPYDTHKAWTLDSFSGSAVTMIVYARFGDANGNELPNSRSSDNIILDVTPPSGSVTLGSGASAASGSGGAVSTQSPVRTVQLAATDTQSGGSMTMRLSNRADFAGAVWKPFEPSVSWDFSGGGTVYAQFKDGAGNLSQPYSQTLPGAAPPGTSPTPPSCSPRPPVQVTLARSSGAIVANLQTTGANNGLRAVRFDSFAGASVDVGSQTGQAQPFAVSIPAGQEPPALQFTVRRLPGAQSATVRLVVVDGCGEWSTLVGGGPSAW